MVVALGAYFGERSADQQRLIEWLLGEQLDDGGWNCEAPARSRVASFNTTILALEGLLEVERVGRRRPGDHGGPRSRRGVPPRAAAVPVADHRRGDQPDLDAVLLPAAVALRRAAWARVLPRRRARRPTRGAARPSTSCAIDGAATGDGRSSTPTGRARTSRWRTATASRAAGTRSAPCGCCAGTTASPSAEALSGRERGGVHCEASRGRGDLAAEGGDHVGSRVPHVLRRRAGRIARGRTRGLDRPAVVDAGASRRVSGPGGPGGGGGGGAGRPDPTALVWEHFFDAASTRLLGFVASGRHIPKAELHVTRAGGHGGRDAWLIVLMEDVTITSVVDHGLGRRRRRADRRHGVPLGAVRATGGSVPDGSLAGARHLHLEPSPPEP